MAFSEFILLQIQSRAGFKCEYCKRKLSANEGWEVEHIIPQSKGGTNELENLAYSCSKCNNNKREFIEYFDPVTGDFSSLFNPRKMNWEEHFSINIITNEIIGISKTGRATANLLFKYTGQIVLPQINWPDLNDYKENVSIVYDVINKLRLSLFQNKFSLIQQSVDGIDKILLNDKHRENQEVKFILQKLKLESYNARASEKNMVEGIKYASKLLADYAADISKKIELYNI